MALTPITAQSADRICALLIGPAGIGKTSQIRCLLGQDFQGGQWVQTNLAPEKVLVLSAEGGLLCVRDLVASGQVQGFEIHSLTEFHEALRYVATAPEVRQDGFRWVSIDSLTEIASRCAEELQRKYPSKADSLKLWGEYNQVMTDIVKSFRDLTHINVVFTCLINIEKDKEGRRFPMPDISGSSLKQRLTSYFDEVLVLDRMALNTGDPENPVMQEMLVFNTRNPVGLAKDRSGKLAETEYPNLLMIRNKILG